MHWLNEPKSWQRTGGVLQVGADPGTDFWRVTGYGYVRDTGHLYGEPITGDLDIEVLIRGRFHSQYDQAGVMLRADERVWLKAGVEFFGGRLRLSTVLTVGYSSWMLADLPADPACCPQIAQHRGERIDLGGRSRHHQLAHGGPHRQPRLRLGLPDGGDRG